ncbi:anthocyanidin 3-O-glucosyltransferase 5-like [Chenopodium quinoa]|uniref:Glycosyltransferase n=1 Tax=Chenopodium quinoa TaxID=63459 RepID=A0A803KVX9_CHEQI|nr:anthocyanidin 3-O-glucosyltransferase 5-like [Chenopodium quinoa]
MVIPSKVHVALLASPGLGHLIPTVELAKCLAAKHGVTITVFAVIPEDTPVQDELLRSATSLWPELINTVVLPSEKDFPSDVGVVPRMLAMVRSTFPALRSSINGMVNKPVALIVDYFSTEAIEAIAQELNMLKYVFIATNARCLYYNFYLPYVKKEANRDEPIYAPESEPIMDDGQFKLVLSLADQTIKELVRVASHMAAADGILVNTWEDLEAKTLNLFKEERFMKHISRTPVHPIGPLVRAGEPTGSKPELMKWLDRQPNKSVVYVSFGSGGTLSAQQTIELALGLELSEQRFIWVVRPPIENDSCASLFKSKHSDEDELFEYLPDGFLNRTRNVGFVVPMWAPQEEILTHGSVGAFVSHCGWNSSQESIVNGVPIITWPLYAEQHLNAVLLTKEFGIAVGPQEDPSKELVKRDEIAKMVRRVMVNEEGIGIRTRVNEFKASAKEALSEGGTSYISLSKVVEKFVI